jgi:hypothetical protein
VSLKSLLQAGHGFLHVAQDSPKLVIAGVEYAATMGTQNTASPLVFGGEAEEIDCTAIISKADMATDPAVAALASHEAENIRYRIVAVREPAGGSTYELDLRRDAREYYLQLATGSEFHLLLGSANAAKLILN